MNVEAAKAGQSEAKDRGSVSESLSWKDQRTGRLQVSYLNESFWKERKREREGYLCVLWRVLFLVFGVMSYKSIYYSMWSVFKCNLRKKRRKWKKRHDGI